MQSCPDARATHSAADAARLGYTLLCHVGAIGVYHKQTSLSVLPVHRQQPEPVLLGSHPSESDNVFDKFAVAVLKDNIIVGHIPREISRICWYFLQKRQSSIVCRITDHRRLSDVEGKGLVVPCIYIFAGRTAHVERLISLFL